jgi:hypothetical protein
MAKFHELFHEKLEKDVKEDIKAVLGGRKRSAAYGLNDSRL